MNLINLCGPIILYLGFSLIQIIIDIFRSEYIVALLKFIVMIIFSVLLNILCSKELTVVAWLLVFIPFIFMTVIVSLLLLSLGMDSSSKLLSLNNDSNITNDNCEQNTNVSDCLENQCYWVL